MNPDISRYINLPLVEKNSQDVYETAAAWMRILMPGIVLREGHIETVLLEALALEVSKTVYAINKLPSAFIQAFLAMQGCVS